jgi:Mg2+ and Co2+ transporter CorA
MNKKHTGLAPNSDICDAIMSYKKDNTEPEPEGFGMSLYYGRSGDGESQRLLTLKSFKNLDSEQIKRIFGGSDPFWINFSGYDSRMLKAVCKIFGIHSLTMNTILSEESRERCDVLTDHFFLEIFGFLGFSDDEYHDLETEIISVICCDRFLLTFHLSTHQFFTKVYNRLNHQSVQMTAPWMFYMVFDRLVDDFVPLVRQAEIESGAVDELVLILTKLDQVEMLKRIASIRKLISSLTRANRGKIDICKIIQSINNRFPQPLFERGILTYLLDVTSHVNTMDQSLVLQEEIVHQAHAVFMARLNIGLTESSNRMSDNMKMLGAIACVFGPLMVISGAMGMNVKVPLMLDSDQDLSGPYWFLLLLTVEFFVALISIWIVWRAGYLKLIRFNDAV